MSEKIKVDELVIDGITYVPKDSIAQTKQSMDGLDYVLVRTFSAGVHCGFLAYHQGKEVKLYNAIRIWYWSGAASLSQLAMEGVKNPDACKFAMSVDEITLTEAIEIIPMTETAFKSVTHVKAWKK